MASGLWVTVPLPGYISRCHPGSSGSPDPKESWNPFGTSQAIPDFLISPHRSRHTSPSAVRVPPDESRNTVLIAPRSSRRSSPEIGSSSRRPLPPRPMSPEIDVLTGERRPSKEVTKLERNRYRVEIQSYFRTLGKMLDRGQITAEDMATERSKSRRRHYVRELQKQADMPTEEQEAMVKARRERRHELYHDDSPAGLARRERRLALKRQSNKKCRAKEKAKRQDED